jgi:lipid-binding SYLF domain-containing protein
VNERSRLAISAATILVALLCVQVTGCKTLSAQEQAAKRAELDAMAEQTVAALRESDPQFEPALESSLGYVVIDMSVAKIPVIGTGSGAGVVVDKRNDERSYLRVSRFEVGGGMGAQKFQVVITFDDPQLLDRMIQGTWRFRAGAEAAVGSTSSVEGRSSATKTEGYRAFRIVESGAVATVTVKVARARPWLE